MFDFLAALMCSFFGWCADGACREVSFRNVQHTVCSFEKSKVQVQLHLNNSDGRPYRYLGNLKSALNDNGVDPLMLMNGGMYHEDLEPVGLYVENATQHQKLSTRKGPGNFHLLPNGVFLVHRTDGPMVIETEKLAARLDQSGNWAKQIVFATQSGPMLVIDGKLHPRFIDGSDSLKIRNGVGLSNNGKTLHFAISHSPINFWNFGKLFQQELKTQNALFLDGTVSALRSPNIQRGGWRQLGPMISVTRK